MITSLRSQILLFAFFFFLLVLLFVPFFVEAQSTIVPDVKAGQFDFCTVGTVVKNAVNFTITIAIAVSALMFGIAGFYFFTSGGQASRISKGKTIFTSVVIGIAFVIGAWLVVDTIIQVLTNQKYGLGKPWVSLISGCKSDQPAAIGKIKIAKDGIEGPLQQYCSGTSCHATLATCQALESFGPECKRANVSTPTTKAWCSGGSCHTTLEACQKVEMFGPTCQETTLTANYNATSNFTHDQARALINSEIQVVSSGSCSDKANFKCTSLVGLTTASIKGVNSLLQDCKVADPNCTFKITGATETGHAPGNTGTHGAGHKLDLSMTTPLNNFVEKQPNRFRYDGIRTWTACSKPVTAYQYTDKKTGDVYLKEIGGCGDHWDVKWNQTRVN